MRNKIIHQNDEVNYEYFLKDHLGNVRATFADYNGDNVAELIQEDSYYPYGLTMQGLSGLYSGTPKNKFLYNGKELHDELNTNWYDYGARMYDPEIARWHVKDHMAEKMKRWSPYNYAFNNPVRFNDPDGMKPQEWNDWQPDMRGEEFLHGKIIFFDPGTGDIPGSSSSDGDPPKRTEFSGRENFAKNPNPKSNPKPQNYVEKNESQKTYKQKGGYTVYSEFNKGENIGDWYKADYIYNSWQAGPPVAAIIEVAGKIGEWINSNKEINQQRKINNDLHDRYYNDTVSPYHIGVNWIQRDSLVTPDSTILHIPNDEGWEIIE